MQCFRTGCVLCLLQEIHASHQPGAQKINKSTHDRIRARHPRQVQELPNWPDVSGQGRCTALLSAVSNWDALKPTKRAKLVSTVEALDSINEHDFQTILSTWMSLPSINENALITASKIFYTIDNNGWAKQFPETWKHVMHHADEVMHAVSFLF